VKVIVTLLLSLLIAPFAGQAAALNVRPNIVIILADDLGYGDVRCYNEQSKVATPNIDRLAREGMRFTDAHSPATA
jgi:arylsulfatase A-like enzyme